MQLGIEFDSDKFLHNVNNNKNNLTQEQDQEQGQEQEKRIDSVPLNFSIDA